MAKRGTHEHPKTRRLARLLKQPPYAALGLLEAIWHWVGRYAPTGFLTPENVEDLQEYTRFKGNLEKVLVETGWLDVVQNGFFIHDWHDHADDNVKKNLKNQGKQFYRKNTFEPTIRESVANDSSSLISLAKPSLAKPSPTVVPTSPCPITVEVIKELATLTGKPYDPKAKYCSGLNARIAEGASVEVLLGVVRHKHRQWGTDPKMRAYLTPGTLFRPANFEKYALEISSTGTFQEPETEMQRKTREVLESLNA